jgi:hypothetical protein
MKGGGSFYFGSFYGIVGPRHKNPWEVRWAWELSVALHGAFASSPTEGG